MLYIRTLDLTSFRIPNFFSRKIEVGLLSHLGDIVQSFMFTKMNPFNELAQQNKLFNFSK